MSFDNNSVVRISEAETFDERYERMLSYFDHLPRYASRGKPLDWDPRNNICAVVTKPEGNNGYVKHYYPGANIVTNDGDIFYAKRGAGETPAANEGASRMELANPATANATAKTDTYGSMTVPITASRKTFATGYPKTNDADADNTGKGTKVVTYLCSWGTTDFNDGGTTIKNGVIHDNASPVSATKVVTHWAFAAFNKTSSDTLKVFVNHSMLGS